MVPSSLVCERMSDVYVRMFLDMFSNLNKKLSSCELEVFKKIMYIYVCM